MNGKASELTVGAAEAQYLVIKPLLQKKSKDFRNQIVYNGNTFPNIGFNKEM